MSAAARWERKRYLPRPVLCDGDGAIGRFRAWATQLCSGLDAPR